MQCSAGNATDEKAVIAKLHGDLDELITTSAPLMWEYASTTCNPSNLDYQDCKAYHSIWQYLVMWKLTTSMRADSGFLVQTVRSFARKHGQNRVLISGAADYALLAHVLCGYGIENVVPAVTVMDRCQTSLDINDWYARRLGNEVARVRSNVFEFEPAQPFDAICTHSFLIWFSLEQQERIIRKWFEMLAPGGTVMTTLRLREGPVDTAVSYSEQEARDLEQRTITAARLKSGFDSLQARLMGSSAYQFAKGRKRYSVDNMEVYRDMFMKAGFIIEQMHPVVSTHPEQDRPSGPANGGIGRLQIVARRE